MAPSAIDEAASEPSKVVLAKSIDSVAQSDYLMDRDLHKVLRHVIDSRGSVLILENGREIYDSSCGAAVACLGYKGPYHDEIKTAIVEQMDTGVMYAASLFYSTSAANKAAEALIQGTDYMMSKAYICNSGSEANEATLKLIIQYWWEINPAKQRTKIVTRKHAYHGATLGALSASGHKTRRQIFEPILMTNFITISECNPYRQRLPNEIDAAFVQRKADELDAVCAQAERDNDPVAAFLCEPVSGAALGCMPYVPGYLAAMKVICRKHGALFVLDEVMCGMGRCGTLHAWQAEHDPAQGQDCVPDIQPIGKGIAAGYMPTAAILIGPLVYDVLKAGSGAFVHGQTYQAFPASCAAIAKTQEILRRDGIVANVRAQGGHLARLLHARLDSHPMIGDIRGLGLFWAIEFVRDKATKTPFERSLRVADMVSELAFEGRDGRDGVVGGGGSGGVSCGHGSTRKAMSFYPGQGCVDGWCGDHVILAPAYVVTTKEIEGIVETVVGVVEEVYGILRTRGVL